MAGQAFAGQQGTQFAFQQGPSPSPLQPQQPPQQMNQLRFRGNQGPRGPGTENQINNQIERFSIK